MKINKEFIWLDIQNVGINLIISIIFFVPVYFLLISANDLIFNTFAEKLIFSVLWFGAINCCVYIGRCMWHCGY